MALSWEIQPSEFWDMTLPEWFCIYEFRRDKEPGDYAGRLTREEVWELYEWALDGTS